MYGLNANYDGTAATTGVPISTRHGAHDEDLDVAHVDDPTKTQATSLTEAGIDEKTSAAETLGKSSDDDNDNDSAEAEMVRRSSVVQALARSYSRTAGAASGQNPFLAGPDSPLNPASPNFSGREWAKSIVELVSQGGSSFRSAGVCFQNLNVHGYGAATDFQKDVANVWLSLAGLVRTLTGSSGRQRIDILRQFDGLVHKGEMLVVLGPPGSGCSTFLKTIAGEMNGLYVDDGSYFNYQGKPASLQRSPDCKVNVGLSWVG